MWYVNVDISQTSNNNLCVEIFVRFLFMFFQFDETKISEKHEHNF
jgi:hypothetical protein